MVQAGARDAFPNVPSGTVTFLFTDIEGSTKLLEQLREGYAAGAVRPARPAARGLRSLQGPRDRYPGRCVLRRLLPRRGRPPLRHRSPASPGPAHLALRRPVRVRMGLHTGEPIIAPTGYVGMDVHRAARIGAAGHGGQVLLSQTTRDLIYQDLPPGAHVRRLGEYQLKDIRIRRRFTSSTLAGLPTEFAPLKIAATAMSCPRPAKRPSKACSTSTRTMPTGSSAATS